MRIKTLIVLCMVIFAFSLTRSYSAERTRIDDITKILQYFKNYRFGEVSIWEVKDAAELKEIVATKKKKISTGEAATSKECVNQIDQNIRIKYVRSGVLQEKSLSAITLDILNDGLTPDNELLKCVYQHYVDSLSGPVGDKVIHAYIVTTKPAKYGLLPDTIIAMIVIENDFAEDTPRLS
ncbi:MAG: hypothetical protein QG635_2405, partial [Bacteroidota bacterium]|nr:hypothetical protein [Bacteroidota bacterium]